MSVSRMNHAMLSFALMGGMLVGARPHTARPWPPEPRTPLGKLDKPLLAPDGGGGPDAP